MKIPSVVGMNTAVSSPRPAQTKTHLSVTSWMPTDLQVPCSKETWFLIQLHRNCTQSQAAPAIMQSHWANNRRARGRQQRKVSVTPTGDQEPEKWEPDHCLHTTAPFRHCQRCREPWNTAAPKSSCVISSDNLPRLWSLPGDLQLL